MRNQKGYLAGYNGQLVVTAQQVIARVMLSRHPVDRTLLHPLPGTCRQQPTAAGLGPHLRTPLAGSASPTGDTSARARTGGLRPLPPPPRGPATPGAPPPARHP